jgi:hypothetical protein
MRSVSFSVTESPLRTFRYGRHHAQHPARLFMLGQCAGSLLLLLVITAGALAIVATIAVFASTKELIGDSATESRQNVHTQKSVDVQLSLPQQ